MKSTFRIPGGYTIPLLSTITAVWLLLKADKVKLLIGLGAMIIIVPIYFLMKAYDARHGIAFKDSD